MLTTIEANVATARLRAALSKEPEGTPASRVAHLASGNPTVPFLIMSPQRTYWSYLSVCDVLFLDRTEPSDLVRGSQPQSGEILVNG